MCIDSNLKISHVTFLSSQVDSNADLDDLDVLNKDEEEKYFDAEEPEELSVPDITVRTGNMDIETTCNNEKASQTKRKENVNDEQDQASDLMMDTISKDISLNKEDNSFPNT